VTELEADIRKWYETKVVRGAGGHVRRASDAGIMHSGLNSNSGAVPAPSTVVHSESAVSNHSSDDGASTVTRGSRAASAVDAATPLPSLHRALSDNVIASIMPPEVSAAVSDKKAIQSSIDENKVTQRRMQQSLSDLLKVRRELRKMVQMIPRDEARKDRKELLKRYPIHAYHGDAQLVHSHTRRVLCSELAKGDLELTNLELELQVLMLRRIVDGQQAIFAAADYPFGGKTSNTGSFQVSGGIYYPC